MESAFVRYLRTRLFSQNSLARKASLVRFVKTNSCLYIVRQYFPWRNLYICYVLHDPSYYVGVSPSLAVLKF